MRYLKTFENFDFDRIDSDESDYLYVETSQIPNSGKGLFTAIDIEKDEVISVFKGEILSDEEIKLRTESGNDDYLSTLTINGPSGTEIGFSYQIFSLVGGGDRSGVLFPLTGRYTNTSTTAKTICANVRRSTADDNIVFDNNNQGSMTMVVTEIGR